LSQNCAQLYKTPLERLARNIAKKVLVAQYQNKEKGFKILSGQKH